MGKDGLPRKQPGQHSLWFNVLLLVDAFALGGLVIWRLVLSLLESKMVDPLPPAAIDTLTGIDHTLFPYWVGHTGISLLLFWITAGAYLWLRTRLRVVAALAIIVPAALFAWVWASRT